MTKEGQKLFKLGADLARGMAPIPPAGETELMAEQRRNGALTTALHVLLDAVDYSAGNCRQNEMVGAVLPLPLIKIARDALKIPMRAPLGKSL